MTKPSNPLADVSAIKLALLARSVRAESRAVLMADPIAIVGMACRVPGADTPDAFWEMLREGRDVIREVPAERWNADEWFDSDASVPAKTSTKWGGFVDRIDAFDAGYFGILPREAERIDPQQRMFLEVAIEALDDAGLPDARLRGSRTGVFVASYHNDYTFLQYRDLDSIDARTLTGTLHSVLANRLSYFLDLRGPSISIDTACSSSLVAIHLACQSLRLGESDVAIAGGVSLMITPEMMIALSKVGFMAPDGRCRTFDAGAGGFGRGEGCGVVVCKRLSDAIADNDRILAVVRGSAVNQDGHSTLLAAPNGLAQEAMIREALANAQISPARIGFVEAHGTGTALGDPIEVDALATTIGARSPGAGLCYVGAVKANIGHLEAAAGVAGLVKAILCLEHGYIPPQPNFSRLNAHISLDGTRLAIPTALTQWPAGDGPRCAAVSSFGIGGTNAHVIVEAAPAPLAAASAVGQEVSRILPLSAQSPQALLALAEAWVPFLSGTSASTSEICYTAGERRGHFDHRMAIVGRTREDFKEAILDWLTRARSNDVGRSDMPARPRVAFVFSGQGPQWYGMGGQLLRDEPVFRDVISACDALLRPLAGWSLLDEFGAGETSSRLRETEVAQPALFALQVGLASLWKSWGLSPDSVVGHSVGEIAALHIAGVLPLEDAVRVVWHRGHIMQQATGRGRMCAVSLSVNEAEAFVSAYADRLSVGVVNGPRSVVLSGDTVAIEEATAALTAVGTSYRLLPVDYAFHSAQMAPFVPRLLGQLTDLKARRPTLPVYSTVTGARLRAEESVDPAYFARNMRGSVRFADAVTEMANDGVDVFLEIGPHPVLSSAIAECVDAASRSALVLASLKRQRSDRETMLESAAQLYTKGWTPDWAAFQQTNSEPIRLPRYPWQHKRYWIRPQSAHVDARSANHTGHPLLGRRVTTAGTDAEVFEGRSDEAATWLPDHRVFGQLVMPGAALMETLLAAARIIGGPSQQLTGFAIHQPLFVSEPAAEPTRWQTVAKSRVGSPIELTLYERAAASADDRYEWRPIATATGTSRDQLLAASTLDSSGDKADTAAVYEQFNRLGVNFGRAFQGLRGIVRTDDSAEGWVELPADLVSEANRYVLHPVLLDAGLQLCSIIGRRGAGVTTPTEVLLPLGADRFDVLRNVSGRLLARACVRQTASGGSLAADVTFEADGGVVAVIEGMRFASADANTFGRRDVTDSLYEVIWQRIPAVAAGDSRAHGRWLIFCDESGSGDRLAEQLTTSGAQCWRVRMGDRFDRSAPNTFTVNPGEKNDLVRLLADVVAEGGPLDSVVHLWNLDVDRFGVGEASGFDTDDLRSTASILHLVQALVGVECALWIVTRGAQVVVGDEAAGSLRPRSASAWGLASVVAIEHPELQVRCVDLDPAEVDDEWRLAAEFTRATSLSATSRSLAIRHGERWESRLAVHKPKASVPADRIPHRLEVTQAGTLDGVALRPVELPRLKSGEVRLRVLASALNFRDVLMTLGMYPGDAVPLGLECVGVVIERSPDVEGLETGSRVFGYAPGGLGTEVVVSAAFLAPVPAGLRTDDAASIPVAFLTAYYGLFRLAGLRAGQRVLIHAAAGGVGLAAVHLALSSRAEVFATAGSPEKRAYLNSIGVAHVMDSRSLRFADEIRAITSGEGVDVVLNSLAGEFIPVSINLVRSGGTFLELGKRGVLTSDAAAKIRPDVRYQLYDLGADAQRDHRLLRPMFDDVLARLSRKELQPLPTTVYPLSEISDAMRYMAQSRHIGKIVIRVSDQAGAESPLVSPDASYWITGGFGGLGLETARWLVRSGARSMVLTGRRRPSAFALDVIAELEGLGATVHARVADAADRQAMRDVCDEIGRDLPPLRGVIHAAGAIDDAVLAQQTWERCRPLLRGKAHGAEVLHEVTRDHDLDFFVLYSAAGRLLGASGQNVYPAANAALDALGQARRRLGLPALSVAWGAWANVGMMARESYRRDVWKTRGLGRIDPDFAFPRLERLLRGDRAVVAVLPIDWREFHAHVSPEVDRSFFEKIIERSPTASTTVTATATDTVTMRLRTLPAGGRRQALVAELTTRAYHILGLDATVAIDPALPLKELGLDSLMAVELRNELGRAFGQLLPATLLFDYPTVDALADHLLRTLALAESVVDARSPGHRPTAGKAAQNQVAELSDDEAEALLLKELESGLPRRTHVGSGTES